MESLDVCQPEQEALQIPSCVCVPLNTTQSYYDIQVQNLTASFEFHNTSNFGDFTVHLQNYGLPNENADGDSLKNPLNGPSYTSWSPLVALLSPVYNGVLKLTTGESAQFNFNMQKVGNIKWETTAAAAMTNFPMYVCILFSLSVSTIVAEIMKEREKKVRAK